MSPKLRAFLDFMWKKRTLYVAYGMLIAFALVVLIIATPLCVYLPGYLDVHKRALVMESAMRIDSLERENDLRLAYLENMTNILRDRVKTKEIESYDTAVSRIQDTLLTASEREMRFVENYEEQERFGLEALDELKTSHLQMVFIAPVKGKLAVPESGDKKEQNETRVELSGPVPVLVPCEGTVIQVSFLMGEGYLVVIQHAQDYITIYSHLKQVTASVGQQLKCGAVMGYAGAIKDPFNNWVGLQVWHKGKRLDPANVMVLEK